MCFCRKLKCALSLAIKPPDFARDIQTKTKMRNGRTKTYKFKNKNIFLAISLTLAANITLRSQRPLSHSCLGLCAKPPPPAPKTTICSTLIFCLRLSICIGISLDPMSPPRIPSSKRRTWMTSEMRCGQSSKRRQSKKSQKQWQSK